MTQFLQLHLPEYCANEDITKAAFSKVCISCLASNTCFVALKNCIHSDFFNYIVNSSHFKLLVDSVVCLSCHSTLRKIYHFKHQAQESMTILSDQTEHIQAISKSNKLKCSGIEITSNIELESSTEPLKLEEVDQNESTDIKVEHNYSDYEIELPLSELKKNVKRKGKRTVKYKGKIKVVTLERDELMLERDNDRLKDAYVKLPYKCDLCIIGFDHDLNLKEHLEKRHTERKGSFVCDICKSVLNTEASYKQHCKRHFQRYECEKCGRRNNTLHTIIKHYNESHGTIDTTFTCQECGFTTKSHRSYRYHRDKHKGAQKCPHCANTFVNKPGLRLHLFNVHKQSDRRYLCIACDKSYSSKSGLMSHASSAHAPAHAAAYCAACRTHFTSANTLKHHLKTHSKHVSDHDKRFVCEECGEKFLTKPQLQDHVDWVHLKQAKHECSKCDKVFKNLTGLKKHKSYVHEKKRPPRNKICDHCGRGFTTMSILRSHIRTHTGERPLQCSHCPATFAHSAALYTHNKLLHSSREHVT